MTVSTALLKHKYIKFPASYLWMRPFILLWMAIRLAGQLAQCMLALSTLALCMLGTGVQEDLFHRLPRG